MGARLTIYDPVGNLRPYPYPYNFLHKMAQLPTRFFLAKCNFTRRVAICAALGFYPYFALQTRLRSSDNKKKWAAIRSTYCHQVFKPPHMPHLTY